jgi:diguanylate cyclase (GGDEF)-like protein
LKKRVRCYCTSLSWWIHMTTTHDSQEGQEATRRLVDIESRNRVTSKSIGDLADKPSLLKHYLESSITNTFSELLYRLTHEIYTEEKAAILWEGILAHRASMSKLLARDVGMLVAALDYLTNISGDILNPKIIDDLQLEAVANIATRDSLTNLYQRSVFDFILDRMVLEHRRQKMAISLLFIDIDDFKKVNDLHGHKDGDTVLRRIGKAILDSLRETDFPARYGGEEITIILPATPLVQATEKANRLCEELSRCFKKPGPIITVSIGVACIAESDLTTTAKGLVHRADLALYVAKSDGKNRVVSDSG